MTEHIVGPSCANYSEVKVAALPKLPYSSRLKLPKRSGIYFLMDDSTVLYVGKALNLRARHSKHESVFKFDQLHKLPTLSIRYMTIPINTDIDLEDIEKAFIKRFRPILNVKYSMYNNKNAVAAWENYIDKKLGII